MLYGPLSRTRVRLDAYTMRPGKSSSQAKLVVFLCTLRVNKPKKKCMTVFLIALYFLRSETCLHFYLPGTVSLNRNNILRLFLKMGDAHSSLLDYVL